jgi:plasmid stabilization system protein ParE
MDFKIVFRDTFLEDLDRVVRSVAFHNPAAASKLGEMIISAGERLSFFPERHPRVQQRRAIRRFIVKKYFKVFYRVHRETMTVEILRCWDGRRGTEPPLSEAEN